MKKTYAACLILCFSLTVLSAAALQKIPAPEPNPGNLRMNCYIPGELDSSGQYPLVLVLHGSMANALLHIYPDLFKAGAVIAAPSYLPRDIIRNMPHIPRLAIIQGESDPVVPPKNATEILMEWMNKYPPGSLQHETEYPYLNNPDLRAQFFFHGDTLHIVRLDMAGVAHQMPVDPAAALPRGGRHSL